MNSYHELNPVCETFDLLAKFDPQVAAEIGAPLAQTEKVENRFFFKKSIENLLNNFYKVTMVSTGDGPVGASKLTGEVSRTD